MDRATGILTVFFEEPFWVGIFEHTEAGMLSVSKVTFGAEPKDYEIYDFILKEYDHLKFSPAVAANAEKVRRNPKRIQREVHKQVENTGLGTKAQQALKLQQEQMKTQRRAISRERSEAEKQRRFELKQQKKKEKHRGR